MHVDSELWPGSRHGLDFLQRRVVTFTCEMPSIVYQHDVWEARIAQHRSKFDLYWSVSLASGGESARPMAVEPEERWGCQPRDYSWQDVTTVALA